jgi:hypothetical protein
MPTVVGVHGICNDYLGEETIASTWAPALRDGLRRAGNADLVDWAQVEVVFYGDLFRTSGGKGGMPRLIVEDLDDTEQALLLALADPLDSGEVSKRAPRSLQAALRLLLRQPFFGALAGAHGQGALLFGLRQVRLYLHDDGTREQIHDRFDRAMAGDTRVVVAHSLGSVVAYECLCTGRFPQVQALVTLGSPLGMPRIVFDCLRPAPVGGRSQFPPVAHWTNIADDGDLVAVVKELRPFFGDGTRVIDERVHNGWESHSVLRYLTSAETGRGIALGRG